VTAHVIEAGLASAILMALVLLIRAPVRRSFGPGVAYGLWALPLLRLMLPPIPEDWRAAAATPVSRAGEAVVAVIVQPAPGAVPAEVAASSGPGLLATLGAVLAIGWAVGAIGFFAWHVIGYLRLRRGLLADHRLVGVTGGVRVIESPAASGPLAFGVRRRYAVMPADAHERYDADECELALAHELAHHARGDLLANWAALAILSLHWVNPLAWRAFRAFRADQELACDARVLAGRGRADRLVYACAIVKAAHGRAVTPACHLHTVEDLKGRLRMLKLNPATGGRLFAGVASVALTAAAGLVLTASGTGAAAAVRAVQEVLPPAPAAPPAPVAPVAPVAAPAIPQVPTAPTRKDGHRSIVVTKRDGSTTTTRTYAPGEPLPPEVARAIADMPTVRSETCRGDTGPASETRTEKGRRVTVICQNRIAAAGARAAEAGRLAGLTAQLHASAAERAAAGARLAALDGGTRIRGPVTLRFPGGPFEHDALRSALASLQLARRNVEAATMPEDARRDALAGIDDGLREVRENLRETK